MRRLITIVAPVYNERENIELAHRQIEAIHEERLADRFDLEVILVDDGSTDGSTEILRRLAVKHDHVRLVILARNFGHQAAISAGYHYANGDVIVTMDSDLQHPAEKIPEMVTRWQEGYDVVYAVREADHGGFLKRWCSRAFYRVFNLFSPTKILPGSADFRLITRQVRDALNQLPERCRFLRGLIPWLGFRSTEVTYTPRPRMAGEPKYRFFHSLGLSVTAFTGFSVAPLRGLLVLGVLFLLVSVGYLVYCFADWLTGGTVVRGWPSIVALIVLTQGLMLIAFGIQAEYLAKIIQEVKQRPEFVVREVVGDIREQNRVVRDTPEQPAPDPPTTEPTSAQEAET